MKKKQDVDQLGRLVAFNFPPQRIVSLVPSQTELLYDLGLGNRVAGITKFCVHPSEWFKEKTKVGGTKKFQFEIIDSLQPDLIIGNKEENYEQGIKRLALKHPLWMSDITSWENALEMIKAIGTLVDEAAKADSLVEKIMGKFQDIKPFSAKRVLYLIWKNPWMGAGKKTFIDAMLTRIGLVNCIGTSRYPELTAGEIKRLAPEIIMLSSEPFPFQEKNRIELNQLVPNTKVILVDGEMFSWYGSRLLKAADYFLSLEL